MAAVSLQGEPDKLAREQTLMQASGSVGKVLALLVTMLPDMASNAAGLYSSIPVRLAADGSTLSRHTTLLVPCQDLPAGESGASA
jgi:hypothetical protein